MADEKWVRIIPHGPATHKTRRYNFDGIMFEHGLGWQRVTSRTARDLASKKDKLGRPIFEIRSEEEALALERKEVEVDRGAPTPQAPVSLGRSDASDVGDLPITDYVGKTARKVVKEIEKGALTEVQLVELLNFEEINDNRRTVLRALKAAIDEFKDE